MSFQLAPKAFWLAELISQFLCFLNSSKNITCPSGKLKTEFTNPIAKFTSPGLSDTTVFARWVEKRFFFNSAASRPLGEIAKSLQHVGGGPGLHYEQGFFVTNEQW